MSIADSPALDPAQPAGFVMQVAGLRKDGEGIDPDPDDEAER